jgi:hypothetical protein
MLSTNLLRPTDNFSSRIANPPLSFVRTDELTQIAGIAPLKTLPGRALPRNGTVAELFPLFFIGI